MTGLFFQIGKSDLLDTFRSFFFFLNTQNALNTNYNSAYFVGVFVRIKDDNPYKIPLMMPGTHLDAQPVVLSLYRFLWLTALHCSPH